MSELVRLQGETQAKGIKLAIVVSRFNEYIVDSLLKGALDALQRVGGVAKSDITVIEVPGAFEIPLAVQKLARSKKYEAILALGCVIRGATPHFDYVAGECSHGLSRVALDEGVPIGFGVLTTDTIEQAIERAGTKAGNKGADCAMTVLEMINLLKKI